MITERKIRKAIAYINKYCTENGDEPNLYKILDEKHFEYDGICKKEEVALLVNRLFDKGFLENRSFGHVSPHYFVARTNKCIFYEENRYEARDLTSRIISIAALLVSIGNLLWQILYRILWN